MYSKLHFIIYCPAGAFLLSCFLTRQGQGHNLIEVATILNLREKEVSEYYREYWNLRGLYDLSQIYEEIKDRHLVGRHS